MWRIFGRQVLRVVKITNWQLARMVAVLVAFDIIVLSAWQASDSPWTAQTIYRTENLQFWSYTHCSPTGGGKDIVFLALLGISKLALLVFGAVMGMATRNVNQRFSESKQIAYGQWGHEESDDKAAHCLNHEAESLLTYFCAP